MKHQSQYHFRPVTIDDAAMAVALFNDYTQKYFGTDDLSVDELIMDWTAPGFDLSEVAQIVEDHAGRLIGYVDVMDMTNPYVNKLLWAVLHPDAWDAVLFHEMLQWAQTLGQGRIPLAPEGSRVYMSTTTIDKDILRKQAFEKAGYQLVRHFYRMVIELIEAPPAPILPEGLTIEPIKMDTEFKPALVAQDEAFQDHWGYVKHPIEEIFAQYQHLLENDPKADTSLWFLAKQGEEIIANCRCAPYLTDDPEMGWVSQLSVRKPWRRQGIGMALLSTAFNEFHRRGQLRVGLGVDAASQTHATRLYEKAGMKVKYRYDSYELELRPGLEISNH